MKKILLAILFVFLFVPSILSQQREPALEENGLVLTPPMGWNSWNKFACDINERLVRETADAMVSSGMKDAGYQYIVIDDCWQISRDMQGNIVADATRFPSGIKALADYVHSKGLKFGLYSDAGSKTCQGRPGGRGYEFQDARTYASWGVDYLKYDWCNTTTQDPRASYLVMRDALRASGRPIVFSLCNWGVKEPWLWGKGIGNLWRTTGDIGDLFQSKDPKGNLGVVDILDLQALNNVDAYAGPGHWNDPDMLEVGNGGMTPTEYVSHFSLWAMLAAPLMAGNDLRSLTTETRNILSNKEVIAIDQDRLGRQGRRVRKDGDLELWVRQLADGSRAVVLFNRGTLPREITLAWEDLGYPAALTAEVRDLWQHKDLGRFTKTYSPTVAPHGVVMITVKPMP
jgi:alpha-galactosidase